MHMQLMAGHVRRHRCSVTVSPIIHTGDCLIELPSVHGPHPRVPCTDIPVPFLGVGSNGLCNCHGGDGGGGDDDGFAERWAHSVHEHVV